LVLLLIIGAKLLPAVRLQDNHAASHSAPSPWLLGSVLCVLGIPWGALVLLGFGSFPTVPFGFVLIGGLAWAALTLLLVRRWTRSRDWGDAHRFALVFGGVLACMIGGFIVFKAGGALRVDWIGKAVLNAAAVAGLLWLRIKT
jgi:hypothetical protein